MSNMEANHEEEEVLPPNLPIGHEKTFVACKDCRIVLSQTQFMQSGCPNCEEDSGPMDRDEVADRTTLNFASFIGVVDSSSSWVARVIGQGNSPSAIYAATVQRDDDEEYNDDEEAEEDEYEVDEYEGAAGGAIVVYAGLQCRLPNVGTDRLIEWLSQAPAAIGVNATRSARGPARSPGSMLNA